MAAPVQTKRIDFGGAAAEEARAEIKAILAREPEASGKVYAALAHKVWTLLIERRLDSDVRNWHVLLQGVRAALRRRDERLAERVAALADLVRESVGLAERSPVDDIARRPHARRILELLAGVDDFMARHRLSEALKIGNSHLSNILVQLIGVGLIERRDRGKEAEFALTARGRELTAPLRDGPDASVKIATQLMRTNVDPVDYAAMIDIGRQAAAEVKNAAYAPVRLSRVAPMVLPSFADEDASSMSGYAPHGSLGMVLYGNELTERDLGKPRSIKDIFGQSQFDDQHWMQRRRTDSELPIW